MMNHSCDPNAVVSYDSGGGAEVIPDAIGVPATARIVALRDIAAGEEIVHPYVDREEPREERRAGLAIYGIQCNCARCLQES